MTDVGNPTNTFSIVTPVFNPSREAFKKCVESVLGQNYPHWEWCVVDDCSTDPWVWRYLQRLAKRHDNIRVERRPTNGGISNATNDAINMSSHSYLVFLDHDDELDSSALATVNHEIYHFPDSDLIYTDEDKINTNGEYVDPFLKPDWSPERLLCQNYCCHLTVVKSDLVKEIGGLRQGFEGAQDHDLLLRLAELPIRVRHIPKILYHWRVSESSTAMSLDSKPYALAAMKRALTEACHRRGIEADLISLAQGYFRVQRRLTRRPLVSVVIPTCGTAGSAWGLECHFIENLLLSSLAKTTYQPIEYVIVFDVGTDENLLNRLRELPLPLRFVEYTGKFNFSKKCNLGVMHSTGEYLIFLNDDMEIITPEWIERIVAHLEIDDVGAVGPLLLYDNGLVQSAGHVNPGPGHFGRGHSPQSPYGAGWPMLLNREASGVTGACLAVRRHSFFEVGGFSEIFPEAFNDVDFGFKLMMSGYRIIWTPDATLFHFESKSRSPDTDLATLETLSRYWGRLVDQDKVDPFIRL